MSIAEMETDLFTSFRAAVTEALLIAITAAMVAALGAFSAFLVALFTEMYGFPLTLYLFSGWRGGRNGRRWPSLVKLMLAMPSIPRPFFLVCGPD